MTTDGADFSPIRVSFDGIPVRDRLAFYREVIGRKVVGLEVSPIPDAPLVADLTLRVLPGLEVVSGIAGASRNERTRELLADGNDGFGLAIVAGGQWRVSAMGQELDQDGTHAYLMSFAEPSSAVTAGPSRLLGLQIPRAALAERIVNVDDAVMRPIPRDCEALRLLRSYLDILGTHGALATPELRQAVATHIYDLVAVMIGVTRDGAVIANARGVAAARLQAAKADITADLGRFDLTVGLIAARQGVTTRHLQRLFETAGETFSAFVLAQRLARAHKALADPRQSGSTVASIVFDCGFADVSHFNRAFRRAYGKTPSDVRASILTDAIEGAANPGQARAADLRD